LLNPQDRSLLLETLRPPAGYALDHAIGCTFSLDLHALLTTPLAFTFFDWEEDSGNITSDPLALLESVRRNADKISIFCQAGQISVPRKQERIFAYLENSVYEVLPPSANGVFHPKIWLIRYTHETEPIHYRFICLSRNLTFDKSWDTVIVLDGLLSKRINAYGINNPIGDFIQQLPSLAISSPDQATINKIEQMQYEARRVLFEPPEGIEKLSFHPIGISGYKNFTFGAPKRRMLVMSPFLSDKFVENLIKQRRNCVIISLQESLEKINEETLQRYEKVFTLSRDAESEESEDDMAEDKHTPLLSGLHAKLFVMDDGWKANVWSGSANATDAAFNTNVEFLVCLRGRLVDLGIDKLLDQEGNNTSFADLLQEYKVQEEVSPTDPIQVELEKSLREVRLVLISGSLCAEYVPIESTQKFQLEIKTDLEKDMSLNPNVKIRCWPITLPYNRALLCTFYPGQNLSFGKISLGAITAFFAFELECTKDGQTCTERFVTKLKLIGEPKDRLQRLLRSLLENKSQVLRLLLLLLADQSVSINKLINIHRHLGSVGTSPESMPTGIPLLESLMKALAQNPEKIDRINRLVEDLCKTDEGQNLFPKGFMPVWKSIWQIRSEMIL
jgi:hypothetical protein